MPSDFTLTGPRATAGTPSRDPRLDFPCVVKPLGLSGSRGVIRANDRRRVASGVRAHLRAARAGRRPRARTGLEDVAPGRALHRRTRVRGRGRADRRDACRSFAIFDKPDPLDGPFFEETIYVTPSALDAGTPGSPGIAQVERAAARSGSATGRCTPSAASRPTASTSSRSRRGRSAGCARARCASASRGRHRPHSRKCFCAMRSARTSASIDARGGGRGRDDDPDSEARDPEAGRGRWKRRATVPGIEDLRITAKPDQLLEPLPEAGSYLGFIFARAPRSAATRSRRRAPRRAPRAALHDRTARSILVNAGS